MAVPANSGLANKSPASGEYLFAMIEVYARMRFQNSRKFANNDLKNNTVKPANLNAFVGVGCRTV